MTIAPTQPVPLTKAEDGSIRMSGSRVALEVVVGQFKQGATAEQIQTDFPSLSLSDIYAALSYYLRNQAEVEDYLREREKLAAKAAARWEGDPKTKALRQKIQRRRVTS